jgi:hypothetical protein
MIRRPGWRLVAVVAAVMTVIAIPSSGAAAERSLPSGFGLGVHAYREFDLVNSWMPQTGAPWTYAYHYLSGGVNTGDGWQSWEDGTPFPVAFANDAGHHGYTPVFVYDQLLASKSSCGKECAEDEHVLTNLNDPKVTKLWFADITRLFRLLSQQGEAGQWGFGGRVVVIVEPHLSGYAQAGAREPKRCFGFCTGARDDPDAVEAAVRSSGVADVEGFDDTYRGFVLATAHLRDRFAPNVLLGYHVSPVAIGDDVRYTDAPEMDVLSIGADIAEFAVDAGVTGGRADVAPYDVIATDVDAADAAYNRDVYDAQTAWWDRSNVTFPNFLRYERWVDAITRKIGLKALLFNIPTGNQRFRSMDDTDGHYQDNRGEYFLSHVDELRRYGVAGLLFGSTTVGATAHFDAKRDGITNPKPVCTRDGDSRSSEPICPTDRAASADDDGGFLREAGAAFYGTASSGLPIVPVAAGAGAAALGAAGAVFVSLRRRRRARGPGDEATTVEVLAQRFEVVRPLGEGAMKRVFLARDTVLARDVALAVLKADELDETALERVRREAQALARLGDHANVVTVYDVGSDGGRPYIVCQYVAGGSLRDVLQGRGRLPVTEAVQIALDVCEALQHAHAAGIIHRDVKPANIWLDLSGRALLGDFGIAASVDVTRMTATGAILGTVAYMAPEQAHGSPVAASDLYATGVVLYEMLAGGPPFSGPVMQVLQQHVHDQPAPPSTLNRAVPPALDVLVMDLLAKEPSARPDAAVTASRLRAVAGAVPPLRPEDVYLEQTAAADPDDESGR